MHEVGKTWFLVFPCIGQRKYSVSVAAGSIAISWPFWTENRAQLSLFLGYNLLPFCSSVHGVYISMYIWLCCFVNTFSKLLNWMLLTIFIFSTHPLITEDHVGNKVPRSMGFDDSNHILSMCLLKACITWHFTQQTGNWHFHEKSPHKVPYLPLSHYPKLVYLRLYSWEQTSKIWNKKQQQFFYMILEISSAKYCYSIPASMCRNYT